MKSLSRFPTLKEIKAEQSRRSLLNFARHNHDDFKAGWFHRELARALERFYYDVEAGLCPRLMIFAPPRHGKTELVSRMFPAWAFGKNPNLQVIATSYAASLAERNCRDVQRIMSSDLYSDTFPRAGLNSSNVRTVAGKALRNSEIFEIVGHRGAYRAAGIGGGITGMGFDIGIIDDPIKDAAEAMSETIRESVWNWYSTTFFTRRSPKHGILIINTRWHDDDLCGRLLASEPEKWQVLNFKALATEDETNRKAGEALHPERYPVEQLLDFKEKYPMFFAAMYQGEPVPESGSLFKREMFEFKAPPAVFDYTFIMGDTAYKDGDMNDYNAFGAFGVANDELYLFDVFRKKISAADIEAPLVSFIRKNSLHPFRGAYIEPKGHGLYLNSTLPRHGVIVPSESMAKEFYKDRTKNKVERANNAIPYMGNRKIFINPAINERDEILKEVLSFPKAKNDDMTDCIIDAIKYAFARQVSLLDVL